MKGWDIVNKLKENRRGFSLVELIVVMAIMAALVLAVTMSLSVVSNLRARSAARRLDAMLSQCKIENLSGHKTELKLWYDSADNVYRADLIRDGSSVKEEELGSGRQISVLTACPADGTTEAPGAALWNDMDSGWDFASVTITGGRTHTIRLVRISGDHTVE